MRFANRTKRRSVIPATIVMVVLVLAASITILRITGERAPLITRWDGLVLDRNFRDLGASLNDCLKTPTFREGRIFRANARYSGWSCDDVGNPDVIYSLNYKPEKHQEYFCRASAGPVVGRHFNATVELSDLEFIENWTKPEVRSNACGFFADGFREIAAGRRVLVHCTVGRDRTGLYSAVLGALAAESAGHLDARMIGAIECDYVKTKSLTTDKYGSMARFIGGLQASGGVAHFFETTCGIPTLQSIAAGREFLKP